jgi:hypothetical protein
MNDVASNGADNALPLAQIQRPARTLLGWLTDEQALHFLSGQRRDVPLVGWQEERAREARAAVAKRPATVDQDNIVRDIPSELTSHVAAMQAAPPVQAFFKEGWEVKLVDLRRVCALQPQVFTDHAEERAAQVDPNSMTSIAGVSLPLPSNAPVPGQFDQQKQAWIITAANPNLRIIGNFAGQVQPGVIGFGFAVALLPSLMQVAKVQKRYVLRDGYHRAYGLLRRGINWVPALIRSYGQFDDLGVPPGLLPPSVYLGDRPPTLSDYDAEVVSESVMLPAFQKMIVIHGLELTPLG